MSELGMGDAFDLDLAATTILRDTGDVRMLVKALVNQLSGALGDQLTVQKKGSLLRKSDEIQAVEASIGKEEFRAQLHGGGVQCTIGHSSGGIRIRSEEVSMDEWLRRLLGALQTEASHSQAARQALENMVIGGPA